MQKNKANESSTDPSTAFTENAVSKGNLVNIHSPLDFIKNNWEEDLEKHKDELSNISFMETYRYVTPRDCIAPQKRYFLLAKFGMIYSVWKTIEESENGKEKFLCLYFRKISNFIVKDATTVKRIRNNKSGEKNQVLYIVTLENNKGYIKTNIEIEGKAKSNYQDFQGKLNEVDNNFQILCTHKEFKTLFEEYIQPKLDEKVVLIYENSGKIKPNTFLGGDFLIENGNIYYANEDGLIPT